MAHFSYSNYFPLVAGTWQGRVDGDEQESLRWHQVVGLVDLRETTNFKNNVVFIGFCCDEGVRRNFGRIGAQDAPFAFRKVLGNLPVHFSKKLLLHDGGDIRCENGNLEEAQFVLGEAITKIIRGGGLPLVLGGGHEVTYGHFQGLRKVYKQDKIGIINIDAHLDIRAVVEGRGNSGTGFYQIAQDAACENLEFYYLAIGIQEISNTKALFNYAEDKKVHIVYADELKECNIKRLKSVVHEFAAHVDHVYLTIDMDAFAAPYAPGVSALAYNGIIPDESFFSLFSILTTLPNLRSVDIAELNPKYDIDDRTARLGASLIFSIIKDRNKAFE